MYRRLDGVEGPPPFHRFDALPGNGASFGSTLLIRARKVAKVGQTMNLVKEKVVLAGIVMSKRVKGREMNAQMAFRMLNGSPSLRKVSERRPAKVVSISMDSGASSSMSKGKGSNRVQAVREDISSGGQINFAFSVNSFGHN